MNFLFVTSCILTQQIVNLLIINLKITELDFIRLKTLQHFQHSFNTSLDKPIFILSASHCIGFTWTGLPIGKHTAIISLFDWSNHLQSDFLIYFLLLCKRWENVIKIILLTCACQRLQRKGLYLWIFWGL